MIGDSALKGRRCAGLDGNLPIFVVFSSSSRLFDRYVFLLPRE